MLRMRVRPEGFKRIRTKLEALQLSAGDRQGPLLRALDAEHNLQVRQGFVTRGASVGTGPWPPWSPKYAKWRARHSRLGKRMMRLTDSLYEKASFSNHAGHIAKWLGNMRFAFGFADDVGYWHQHGSGNLPVRSVVDKTPRQKREFATVLVEFYRKRVRQVLRRT